MRVVLLLLELSSSSRRCPCAQFRILSPRTAPAARALSGAGTCSAASCSMSYRSARLGSSLRHQQTGVMTYTVKYGKG